MPTADKYDVLLPIAVGLFTTILHFTSIILLFTGVFHPTIIFVLWLLTFAIVMPLVLRKSKKRSSSLVRYNNISDVQYPVTIALVANCIMGLILSLMVIILHFSNVGISGITEEIQVAFYPYTTMTTLTEIGILSSMCIILFRTISIGNGIQ